MHITLLNAGQGTDYLFGLVTGLVEIPSLTIDVVDSDASATLFTPYPNVRHFNFMGDNISPQSFLQKVLRVSRYYVRLLRYVFHSTSSVFHIQWDNSFFLFDRTLLLLLYRVRGKKILYTVHNVDRQLRDANRSSFLNWCSLFCAYHLAQKLIVHTEGMREELCRRFFVQEKKIAVIPHGINVRVSPSAISVDEARRKLNIPLNSKVLLFFGLIDRYKGVDIAIDACGRCLPDDSSLFLLIAGKPKLSDGYIDELRQRAAEILPAEQYRFDARFISPEETELYFTAADCVLLPYRRIFQSGVLFLAYRFGVPVLATNVGNFPNDVHEGETGFLAPPEDPKAFAHCIRKFFESTLFTKRNETRARIRAFAEEQYSWKTIAQKTCTVYNELLSDR